MGAPHGHLVWVLGGGKLRQSNISWVSRKDLHLGPEHAGKRFVLRTWQQRGETGLLQASQDPAGKDLQGSEAQKPGRARLSSGFKAVRLHRFRDQDEMSFLWEVLVFRVYMTRDVFALLVVVLAATAACSSQDAVGAGRPADLVDMAKADLGVAPSDVGLADTSVSLPQLTLDLQAQRMHVGQTQQVQVKLEGVVQSPDTLSWRLSPPQLARLKGRLLHALAPGQLELTACLERRCASAQVDILAGTPEPVALEIEPSSLLMIQGQQAKLTAYFRDDQGQRFEANEVQWSSDDAVNLSLFPQPQGLVEVQANLETDATITARAQGFSASVEVKSRRRAKLVVESTPSGPPYQVGQTLTFVAHAYSHDGLKLEEVRMNEIVWTLEPDSAAQWVAPDRLKLLEGARLLLHARWQGLDWLEQLEVEIKWKHVACGMVNCCGIATSSDTFCWGSNTGSILGPRVNAWSIYPIRQEPSIPFESLSVSTLGSCGLTSKGEGWCWGENRRGMVGDGTTINRPVPVKVQFPKAWTRLETSEGGNTCGLTVDDELYCWGAFPTGIWDPRHMGTQMPRTATQELRPVLMTQEPIEDFSVGQALCARRQRDHVWMCMGNNSLGEVGVGDQLPRRSFVDLLDSSHFVQLTTGGDTSCASDRLGGVWCWGTNAGQALGQPYAMGPIESLVYPTPTLTSWREPFDRLILRQGSIAQYSCIANDALKQLKCWGTNDTCVLNQPAFSPLSSYEPVLIEGVPWGEFAVGDWAMCVLTKEHDIFCWGSPSHDPRLAPNFRCDVGFSKLPSFPPP